MKLKILKFIILQEKDISGFESDLIIESYASISKLPQELIDFVSIHETGISLVCINISTILMYQYIFTISLNFRFLQKYLL